MTWRWLRLLGATGLGIVCLLPALAAMAQTQPGQPLRLYLHGRPEVNKTGPQVEARVTVLGPEGLPLSGLTADDFLISEPDRPPEPPLTVREETDQGVRLVLALDLSMHYSEDLDLIKKGANAVIDRLGPQDHLTIRTFYNDLGDELFTGYVTGTMALKDKIDSQVVTGDRTTFYRIAEWGIQALDRDDPATQGRQAMIVLTNMNDNIDPRTIDEAREAVQKGDRPLYIISFGDRADQTQLRNLAEATNGLHFHLPEDKKTPNNMAEQVEMLMNQLRPSYVITFLARPAPQLESEQEFTIQATAPGGATGALQGWYQLEAGQGQVTLPSEQHIPLGQFIDVTALVTMTYSVESVTFQVDNGPSLTDHTPPYTYRFNGTEAGVYTLTAQAVDRLGFSTPVAVTTLEVLAGIDVFEVVEATLGETVRLEVAVDKPAAVQQVELRRGNEVITRTTTSPYYLSLRPDTPYYPTDAGYHEFNARVIGENGSIDQARILIRFAKPGPGPGGAGVAPLILGLAAGHLLLPLFLLWWWSNRNKQQAQRVHHLRLLVRNAGNIPARFQVVTTAIRPPAALQFQAGRVNPAPWQLDFEAEAIGKAVPVRDQIIRTESAVDTLQPDQAGVRENEGKEEANLNPQEQQVFGKMGGAAGRVLNGLDFFGRLPLVGGSFRNVSHYIRRWQGQARGTKTRSKRLARFFNRFSRPVEPETDHPETVNLQAETKKSAPPPKGLTPARSSSDTAPVLTAKEVWARKRIQPSNWATPLTILTGLVEASQTGEIELWVRPTEFSGRTQCYTVQIRSNPVVSLAGEADRDERLTQTGVTIKGMHWVYRYFGLLALTIVLAVIIIDARILYQFYWA